MPEWIIELFRTGDLPLAIYLIYQNWNLSNELSKANVRIDKLTRHFLRVHGIVSNPDDDAR